MKIIVNLIHKMKNPPKKVVKTIETKKVKSMPEAYGKTAKANLAGGRVDKASDNVSSAMSMKGGKVLRPMRQQENAMGDSSPRKAAMKPISKTAPKKLKKK